MSIKKTLTIEFLSGKAFFFNRKLLALFIFFSLSVNGFAPSASEVSKYSFVMAAITVTKNLTMQIFEKCDQSITMMARNFCFNINNSLASTPLDQSKQTPLNNNEKSSDKSTAPDAVYLTQYVPHEKILKDELSFYYLPDGYFYNRLVSNSTYTAGYGGNAVIVLFLLFIAAILRRKDIDKNIIGQINILKKEFSV